MIRTIRLRILSLARASKVFIAAQHYFLTVVEWVALVWFVCVVDKL